MYSKIYALILTSTFLLTFTIPSQAEESESIVQSEDWFTAGSNFFVDWYSSFFPLKENADQAQIDDAIEEILLTCEEPVQERIEKFKLNSLALRYDRGDLRILDQQKLPGVEEWIKVESPEQMVEIITSLKVRGAPLIGVSATLALAQMAEKGASLEDIENAAELLRNARPTAVNLAICIDRVLNAMKVENDPYVAIIQTAEQIFQEDVELCDTMGEIGAGLIAEGENILTYCNTGGLATAGIGTALGVIKKAHEQGKKIHVYACETRPLLQGGRLTAWELERCGIPYTLICDNMAASLMRANKINRVLVGADRIAVNGDFANKIGTYSVAVLAKHHKVPFHVVAPYTTIDPKCTNGKMIQIEQRSPNEVRGAAGSFGKVIWSPKNAPVYNPAFDITPASLVTSYILDSGNFVAKEISILIKNEQP